MILGEVKFGIDYEIVAINLPKKYISHLTFLGLKVGSYFSLISKTKSNAVIMVKSSRLALDNSILSHIDIVERHKSHKTIPLSDLQIGQFAYIDKIYAIGETKRRLMDMGLTRHTKIYMRKIAPLGDPIEINLRGYELTLRKSEAKMINVFKMDDLEE